MGSGNLSGRYVMVDIGSMDNTATERGYMDDCKLITISAEPKKKSKHPYLDLIRDNHKKKSRKNRY